jgi:hypothetical protein
MKKPLSESPTPSSNTSDIYLPSDNEIREFVSRHIMGSLTSCGEMDIDFEGIVKDLKDFLSGSISRVLSLSRQKENDIQ